MNFSIRGKCFNHWCDYYRISEDNHCHYLLVANPSACDDLMKQFGNDKHERFLPGNAICGNETCKLYNEVMANNCNTHSSINTKSCLDFIVKTSVYKIDGDMFVIEKGE